MRVTGLRCRTLSGPVVRHLPRAGLAAVAALAMGTLLLAGAPRAGAAPAPAATAHAAAYRVAWAKTLPGPSSEWDAMSDVVTDAQGNAYFVGTAATAGRGFDFFAVKYSPSGKRTWTYTWYALGTGDDGFGAQAVWDGARKRLYAAFTTTRSDGHAGIEVLCLTSGGRRIWMRDWAAPVGIDCDHPVVALDRGHALLVAFGTYQAFDGGYAQQEGVVVKYSPAGAELWSASDTPLSGHGFEISGIATGPGSQVCVTGSISSSASDTDIGTMMFAADGTVRWASNWNNTSVGIGDAFDYGQAVCTLPGGDVAVAGYSATEFGDNEERDTVLIRYDGSGLEKWVQLRDDGRHDVDALLDVVYAGGNLYAGGWGTAASGYDGGLLESYTAAGAFRWSSWWTGPGPGYAEVDALAVAGGKLYFGGCVPVGSGAALGVGCASPATGHISWTTTYDNNGTWLLGSVWSMAVVRGKSIFVAGTARRPDDSRMAVAVRFKP